MHARELIQGLARRAIARDEAAFDELHRLLQAPVLGFLRRRLPECASATLIELRDDALSDALMALRHGEYDAQRCPFTYFVLGCGDIAARRHRRRSARAAELVAIDAATQASTDDMTPEQMVARGEQVVAAHDCLTRSSGPDALGPDERQAIIAFAESRISEVAAARGVSVSTVYAWKDGAEAKLRRCMARKGWSAMS